MALIGLILAAIAILVSFRAVAMAEQSATAEKHSNADSLGTEVEVSTFHYVDAHKRWKFGVLGISNASDGSLPFTAEPGEEFTIPGDSELLVTVAAALEIRNTGHRRASVLVDADRLIENVRDTSTMPITTIVGYRNRQGAVDLNAGETKYFFAYRGLTLGEWFRRGAISASMEFEIKVHASAGPDASTQHWVVQLAAPIFELVQSNSSGARIVATTLPNLQVRQGRRTYPSDSKRRFLRKFFFSS
jgi:hypothetical protein